MQGAPVAGHHGVVAPARPWRPRVAPATPEDNELPVVAGRQRRWTEWAELLCLGGLFGVVACACGGRRTVIAAIRDGLVGASWPSASPVRVFALPFASTRVTWLTTASYV